MTEPLLKQCTPNLKSFPFQIESLTPSGSLDVEEFDDTTEHLKIGMDLSIIGCLSSRFVLGRKLAPIFSPSSMMAIQDNWPYQPFLPNRLPARLGEEEEGGSVPEASATLPDCHANGSPGRKRKTTAGSCSTDSDGRREKRLRSSQVRCAPSC